MCHQLTIQTALDPGLVASLACILQHHRPRIFFSHMAVAVGGNAFSSEADVSLLADIFMSRDGTSELICYQFKVSHSMQQYIFGDDALHFRILFPKFFMAYLSCILCVTVVLSIT